MGLITLIEDNVICCYSIAEDLLQFDRIAVGIVFATFAIIFLLMRFLMSFSKLARLALWVHWFVEDVVFLGRFLSVLDLCGR